MQPNEFVKGIGQFESTSVTIDVPVVFQYSKWSNPTIIAIQRGAYIWCIALSNYATEVAYLSRQWGTEQRCEDMYDAGFEFMFN